MFENLPTSGLVILIGAPCSGKSTFASLAFPPSSIVSTDEVRSQLTGTQNNLAADDGVFRVLLEIVTARLRVGQLTVVDSTASRFDVIELLLRAAEEASSKVEAIHLDSEVESCVSRSESRAHRPIPGNKVREIAFLAAETASKLKSLGLLVRQIDDVMPVRATGRSVFLAMPVTENIGREGFRADKRRYYRLIHDALQFGGFAVASAAVNEDYGTINLEPSVFTRYDIDEIAAADCLVVATPSSLSPDIYLEVGLATGAGKPVGIVLPAGGRFTAMMRGLIDLGTVQRVEFDEDRDLPRLALAMALELVSE